MRLPDLPVGDIQNRREMVTARGLNYSDNIQDGDLAVCQNLSNRRWPYLATRNARKQQAGYENVTALTNWNGLVAVRGTDLLYQGNVVGQVTAGEKQFAAVNTKLVIWPDKVYLDMNELALKPLGAETTATKAVFSDSQDSVTFTGTGDLTQKFRVGDGVEFSGFSTLTGNNRSLVIKTVTADTITIAAKTFTAGTESGTISIKRKIPDLDFICESGNRLWGVSNEEKTIYSSVLGDPSNFYVYDGLSTDGYALPIGSEGDFTGCCKLSTSLLFWKERTLHKILGDYPAEYVMYSYDIEGLRAGCHRSQTIINDVLFYVGLHGVFTYAGGSPSDLSTVFGQHELTEAVGETDGEKYYLSALDNGSPALFTFNPNEGAWLKEDSLRFTDAARVGKDVYLLKEDGTVWLEDAGEDDPDVDWVAEYTPFYETIEGRKRFSRVMFRVELSAGAWVSAFFCADNGPWVEVGKITRQKVDTVSLMVAPSRCDQYRVKLEGHGPCVVKAAMREFIVGGYG